MAEEKRQFDEQMALTKSKSYSISSTSDKGDKGDKGDGGVAAIHKDDTSGKKVSSTYTSNNPINTSSSSNNATMRSITALGYGPISAKTLDALVRAGKVEEYTVNGVTMFRNKTPNTSVSNTYLSSNPLNKGW